MANRKIVLYRYNIDTQELDTYLDMTLERQTIDMESRNERERVYAVNIPKKIRYEIAGKSDTIFYDRDSHTYLVWFDKPDHNMAINAIGNYIINNIDAAIRDTEHLLKSQQDEKLAAINLLDYLK